MPAPFRFLDRVDALVGGSASVLESVRALVLPGGDRAIRYEADRVPRFPPLEDIRRHVQEVALDVVTERVREGLVAALAEHLAEVRAEYELLEGEEPQAFVNEYHDDVLPDEAEVDAWHLGFDKAALETLDGELFRVATESKSPLAESHIPNALADVVLAAPVNDPAAVLARAGVTPEALGAIVDEVRRTRVLSDDGEMCVTETIAPLPSTTQHPGLVIGDTMTIKYDWSPVILAGHLQNAVATNDVELLREGVAYVLTDPDVLETGAELLRLAGDAAFLEWARGRLASATDEENAAAVAEVLRLAGLDDNEEGGNAIAIGSQDAETRRTETAAGADEGDAPAAQHVWTARATQMLSVGELAPLSDGDIPLRVVRDADGKLTHLEGVVPHKSVAESSDLTRAVSAALAALFDHGCETDKAMAAALGVDRAVVAGARKGKEPWAPDGAARSRLSALLRKHAEPLAAALADMEVFGA